MKKLSTDAARKGVIVLLCGFVLWALPELYYLPTNVNAGLIDKLILTKPVVLAIRISIIFLAFGLVGLIVSIRWQDFKNFKIGSGGIEIEKLDEISEKTQKDLTAKDEKIKELEEINETLLKQRDQLRDLVVGVLSALDKRGAKNES